MDISQTKSQSGQMIIIAIVFMTIITAVSAALLGYTTLNLKGTRKDYAQTQALYLAEAGLNKAIESLNHDPSYSGENNTVLGNGEFTVSLMTTSGSNKRITVTGYVPTAANPVAARTVKATVSINTAAVGFNFGVQVGSGGLTMSNGSQINGNVFSNGGISGSGTVTGDASVAMGAATAANQQWTTQNGGLNVGDAVARHDLAQSFIPSDSQPVSQLSVYLKKTGSPSDLTVRILADNHGQPSANVLGSGSIAASKVTGSYGFVDTTLADRVDVIAGQTYWLELSAASVNPGKYFTWGVDTANGYSGGMGKYSAGWNAAPPIWNDAGGDLDFKVFLGGVSTSLSGVIVQGNVHADSLSSCVVNHDAYYATANTCAVGGTSYPDTPAPAPEPMPISDAQISDWEAIAAFGGTIAGPLNIAGTMNLGPVKVEGDLSFTNGAVLNLTGPVWVKGNVTIANNAVVQIDASLGNNGTMLIADDPDNPYTGGKVIISNNSTIIGNGNPNSYPMILSTNISTYAMDINNNSAGAIYYASKGTIQVANNGGGNQITGYAINLNNNASVTYQTGLQSATFSSGPGGAWMFTPGSFVIMP